jgi:hypothetical protein
VFVVAIVTKKHFLNKCFFFSLRKKKKKKIINQKKILVAAAQLGLTGGAQPIFFPNPQKQVYIYF